MRVSFSYVLYTKIQKLFLSLSIFLFLQKKKKNQAFRHKYIIMYAY